MHQNSTVANNKSLLSNNRNDILPGISIDNIILGFDSGSIKILLRQLKKYDKWMLPGGFIFRDESVDNAALRILHEKISLANPTLTQFHLFGEINRTSIDENKKILDCYGEKPYDENVGKHWLLQRFISIGYYIFVEYSKTVVHSEDNEISSWFDLHNIPELYSDHNYIISKAIEAIQKQLGHIPIERNLLPEKFTMSELRIIHECILNKKLDRRNFQRKMLSSNCIIKLSEKTKKKGIKSSTLYSFKQGEGCN